MQDSIQPERRELLIAAKENRENFRNKMQILCFFKTECLSGFRPEEYSVFFCNFMIKSKIIKEIHEISGRGIFDRLFIKIIGSIKI